MRIERGTAMLASIYANAHSKEKYTIFDFAPFHDEPALTLEAAMEAWS